MKIGDKHISKMLHAIGNFDLDQSIPRYPYRNRFLAGDADIKIWKELVAVGYAEESGCSVWTNESGMIWFYVSDAGMKFLRQMKRKEKKPS